MNQTPKAKYSAITEKVLEIQIGYALEMTISVFAFLFPIAEVIKSLKIPSGVRRVLFRTLNTDR